MQFCGQILALPLQSQGVAVRAVSCPCSLAFCILNLRWLDFPTQKCEHLNLLTKSNFYRYE